jgi:aspartate kinase
MTTIAKVFQRIADLHVNVDMVSLSPNIGATTAVSFTISDDDLGTILKFKSELQEMDKIKTIVSSGNCKINVYDENMVNTPGMAARVFTAAAGIAPDLRIITTSDVDISILVTAAEFEQTFQAIQQAMEA